MPLWSHRPTSRRFHQFTICHEGGYNPLASHANGSLRHLATKGEGLQFYAPPSHKAAAAAAKAKEPPGLLPPTTPLVVHAQHTLA